MERKEVTQYCSALSQNDSETVAYNNPLFPVYVRYGILSHYPGYSAISHWHMDLEFILVKKGRMIYNVNGTLVELKENNGIMINSRQIHHGFSPECQECEFICVIVSPELLKGNEWFYQNCIECVTENTSYPYVVLRNDGWQASVLELLNQMYACWQDEAMEESGGYFDVMAAYVSIMKILYRNLPASPRTPEKESLEISLLKTMITYVEEHYMEHMALNDIAAAGACCKSRCALLFKKYLKDTPISYVTKFRLRRSLTALLDVDRQITDIAYEYGFGGASYYCETFRKYYGVSPLRYRKIYQNPNKEV